MKVAKENWKFQQRRTGRNPYGLFLSKSFLENKIYNAVNNGNVYVPNEFKREIKFFMNSQHSSSLIKSLIRTKWLESALDFFAIDKKGGTKIHIKHLYENNLTHVNYRVIYEQISIEASACRLVINIKSRFKNDS